MDDLEFCGDVRFQIQTPLEQYEYSDWVLEIKGAIIGTLISADEVVAEEVQIGQLSVLSIVTRYVPRRMYDICDAHSDYLFEVYQALFNEEHEDTKSELGIEEAWDGLLYLDTIEILERFRHSGVVVQAIETASRCFCPGGIITTHRKFLDLTVDEWRQLGFRRVPGSEIVVRENTRRNPYEVSETDDE